MEWREGERADKKFLKALYATYGDKDLYNSTNFKPHTRNLTTGSFSASGHHCDQCGGKLARSCYEKFHHAYCPTWETRKRKGMRVRERCGERLAILSGGCGIHPRVQGYNEFLYRAAEGFDVKLSDFNDDVNPNKEAESDEKDLEDDMKEIAVLAETIIERGEFLPEDFYNCYRQHRAKLQAYAKQASTSSGKSMLETTEEDKATHSRGEDSIFKSGKTKTGDKRNKAGVVQKSARRPRASYGGALQHISGRMNVERDSSSRTPKRASDAVDGTENAPTAVNTVKLTAKERVTAWWAQKEQQKGTS